jgi:hypothetical protein
MTTTAVENGARGLKGLAGDADICFGVVVRRS